VGIAEQDFFRLIGDVARSVVVQEVEGSRQVPGDWVERVPDTLLTAWCCPCQTLRCVCHAGFCLDTLTERRVVRGRHPLFVIVKLQWFR
jgi:hypothetical protein